MLWDSNTCCLYCECTYIERAYKASLLYKAPEFTERLLAEESSPVSQQARLIVGRRSYHAVNSELQLLQLVAQYLAFLDVAPALAVEACHRVVELIRVSKPRSSPFHCFQHNLQSSTSHLFSGSYLNVLSVLWKK